MAKLTLTGRISSWFMALLGLWWKGVYSKYILNLPEHIIFFLKGRGLGHYDIIYALPLYCTALLNAVIQCICQTYWGNIHFFVWLYKVPDYRGSNK